MKARSTGNKYTKKGFTEKWPHFLEDWPRDQELWACGQCCFPSLEEVALLAQCVCVLQGREGFNLVGKEGVALDPGPNTPRRPVGEGVAAAIVTPHMSTS